MTSWRKGAKDSVIEPRPCTIETKVPEIKQKKYIKKINKYWVETFQTLCLQFIDRVNRFENVLIKSILFFTKNLKSK